MEGRYVTLEPLKPEQHAYALFDAVSGHNTLWDYLFDGPYHDRLVFRTALEKKAASADPLFFAIIDHESGDAAGWASLMRIEPTHRVIEVGNILLTPALQRTRGATESMYLLARYIFDELHYRRYEWKCNALNEPSRRAALRLGFVFEGVFRQHMIVKGRNRDTAWYSMLDADWPLRRAAFERWLSPWNFDDSGRQRKSLGECAEGG